MRDWPRGLDERGAPSRRRDEREFEEAAKHPWASVEWHLNSARTVLFVAYGGRLFAQDEIQVTEYPALGSVREWLTSESVPGLRAVTREGAQATPGLLCGIERRCAVATDADLDEGGGCAPLRRRLREGEGRGSAAGDARFAEELARQFHDAVGTGLFVGV